MVLPAGPGRGPGRWDGNEYRRPLTNSAALSGRGGRKQPSQWDRQREVSLLLVVEDSSSDRTAVTGSGHNSPLAGGDAPVDVENCMKTSVTPWRANQATVETAPTDGEINESGPQMHTSNMCASAPGR